MFIILIQKQKNTISPLSEEKNLLISQLCIKVGYF